MCLGCNPSTSHVRARTDATSAAHYGATGAEHQEGLQAAGKLCPVLAVDLGTKRGECDWGWGRAGSWHCPQALQAGLYLAGLGRPQAVWQLDDSLQPLHQLLKGSEEAW